MGDKAFTATSGSQISVFVENQPGTLADVGAFLGDKGINIYALTLTGGIEHGYVRMVVDKPAEAMEAFADAEYVVYEREVVLLEMSNKPGTLASILRSWGEAGINVEYAYCAGGPSVERGLVVVRVEDTEKALELLN